MSGPETQVDFRTEMLRMINQSTCKSARRVQDSVAYTYRATTVTRVSNLTESNNRVYLCTPPESRPLIKVINPSAGHISYIRESPRLGGIAGRLERNQYLQ